MSRHWCVTLFNAPANLDDVVTAHPHFKYMVYQPEEAPETKREHLQGYIEFDCVQKLSALKKLFGVGNHFEPKKGTREQARVYCMKDESRLAAAEPTELGEWVPDKGKGKRTDLEAACEVVSEKGILGLVEQAPATFVRYHSGMGKLAAIYEQRKKVLRDVEVILHVGEPGTGKSWAVWENEDHANLYSLTTYGKSRTWFEAYTGESVLLIEDFKGQIDYQELLRILDKYPLIIENKGGSMQAKWTKVYITSNFTPEAWYDGQPIEALRRRIHKTVKFDTKWVAPAAAAAPVVIDLTYD